MNLVTRYNWKLPNKKKVEESSKKEGEGDVRHNYLFTWPKALKPCCICFVHECWIRLVPFFNYYIRRRRRWTQNKLSTCHYLIMNLRWREKRGPISKYSWEQLKALWRSNQTRRSCSESWMKTRLQRKVQHKTWFIDKESPKLARVFEIQWARVLNGLVDFPVIARPAIKDNQLRQYLVLAGRAMNGKSTLHVSQYLNDRTLSVQRLPRARVERGIKLACRPISPPTRYHQARTGAAKTRSTIIVVWSVTFKQNV